MKNKKRSELKKRIILLLVISWSIILICLPITSAENQSLSYDSAKNTINMSYDKNNRMVNQTVSSDWVKYFYDKDRNDTLTNVSNDKGVVIKYKYDDKGRVIKETKVVDGISFEKNYAYDSMDRPRFFSGASSIIFSYGNNSLISSIQNFLNISYNEINQPSIKNYDNNQQTNYTYDNNFRLTKIKTEGKQELNYGYDSVGNVNQINDTKNSRFFSMAYDPLNRLIFTKIINYTVGTDEEIGFAYNEIAGITNITYENGEDIYFEYDELPHAPNFLSLYNHTASNETGNETGGGSNSTFIINGLISYLTLNESSGNALDSHNSNDATLVASPTQGFSGKLGTAYDFEYSEQDYLSDNDHPVLSNNTGSISAWVRAESFPTYYHTIIGFGYTSGSDPYGYFGVDGSGHVRFHIHTNGDFLILLEGTDTQIISGNWYHVVVTCDGTNNKLYVNGNEETLNYNSYGDGYWFNDVAVNTFTYGIISRNALLYPWDGLIDEVGIWDRALNSTEISQLYNNGNGFAYN